MSKRRKKSGSLGPAGGVVLALLVAALVFLVVKNVGLKVERGVAAQPPASSGNELPATDESAQPLVEQTVEPTMTPTEPPVQVEDMGFSPHAVDSTKPENLVESTAIMVNDEIVETYEASEPIYFGMGHDYTDVKGVTTFRGNNFRDGGSYGFAEISEGKFGSSWSVPTGSIQDYNGNVWTGNGWTGQPLIVEWPRETKEVMKTMYDSSKEKDGLVEVIYASMDGCIYFLDLETGQKTRDTLYIGYTFKGAGTLDPRGYPILYVGSGVNSKLGTSRAFAISLIDGSILFQFGNGDSFAERSWSMFDSAPLVDEKTDTLIWPGENGLLYLVKLNSQFDLMSGKLSVEPEIVKWRYKGVRTGTQFWVGMETSAAVLEGYAYIADNGGILMCLDLNTLQLVWAQDTLDDTNCSPVISIESGHPYIYISTSFHGGWRAQSWETEVIPIWKVDAETGEIIWTNDSYKCYTEDSVSGGVQGTIALGKYKLEGMIFVPIARTPSAGAGILAALDRDTGEVIWERPTKIYSWSSPSIAYTAEGDGYLIYCTSAGGGDMYILDAMTGEILDDFDCGNNIEASVAIYENTVVVGSRNQNIYGITLK